MLNPFFQQGSQSEQNLVQDLINEQLRMYGVEVYYMPRQYVTKNNVIKEVIQSEFKNSYPIEAYVDSYEGYGGQGTLLSKFGIQNYDDLKIIISKERYEEYISPLSEDVPYNELTSRPKEGDLIYFPLGDRLFEIKYVEHEQPFYQLQKNYVYTLTCSLFRYEDEVIDTGVDTIDDEIAQIGYIQTLQLIGIATTATASAGICSAGSVGQVFITNMGNGYTNIPTVGFSSAPAGGITATGISTITSDYVNCSGVNGGKVLAVRLTNAGCGYTVKPEVKFVPTDTSGAGAAATVSLVDRAVNTTTITGAGSGYITPPTVTFSTPKHVGAAATAVLDTPMVGGGVSITSAPISIGSSSYLFPGGTTGGVFYKKAPTVTFSLPTGSGNIATATATLDSWALTGGTVESVAINTGGRFYTSAPPVTFSAPTGSFGAVATVGLAGSSIDPGSVAFTTTGRAYTTAPTVAISTSGTQIAPLVVSVGIATIHPITGIVTAVGFNSTTDPWCVGTGATIGVGYTVAPSITFSGSTAQYRATGTATIDADGQVNAVSIATSGYGYDAAPTVTIDEPAGVSEQFRALGVATMRYNSIETSGTLGIGSTIITGITTTNIIVGDRIRLASGYDNPLVNFIATDSYVSQIGINTIYMSSTSFNVGIATSAFEFGIDNCGIVTGIGITYGGGGYLVPPTVTIQNDPEIKNYVELIAGITTATGVAYMNSAGTVTGIGISNSGTGYVIVPEITIGSPVGSAGTVGVGTFIFNEVVIGSTSGTTARVKEYTKSTSQLEVSIVDGTFVPGESIYGTESGAIYSMKSQNIDDLVTPFADNDNIETEGDKIIDFSETNPFGMP